MIWENRNVDVKEYRGKRVVDFSDIDKLHKRPAGTAKRAFCHHRNYFIEEIDYYLVKGEETLAIGCVKIPAKGKIVLTESGYLLLIRTFNDKMSWEMMRYLSVYLNGNSKPQNEKSSVSAPRNMTWYGRNARKIFAILDHYEVSRKELYHKILTEISSEFDWNQCNQIYEDQMGYPAAYAMDVVEFFPELSEMATEIVDRYYKNVYDRISST